MLASVVISATQYIVIIFSYSVDHFSSFLIFCCVCCVDDSIMIAGLSNL